MSGFGFPPSFASSSFFILLILAELFFDAHSATYWEDIEALKQFKNGVDSNSVSQGSCLSSWDFNSDPCDNLFGDKFTCGIRCDVVASGSSRVTEISLDQAGYSGSLTSTSWNFPYLQTLDLSNNYFTGSIAESISNLTRLQRLALSRNSLTGSIPSSLGSLVVLEELYLDNNGLQGTIPSSLNGLNSLKRLELEGNKFIGEFPGLGQLSSLYYLDASDNAISGELPESFPASLVELSMRNNQLEGNIPSVVSNLVYLQVIDLSHNKLSGSVPSGFFTHPSLEQLTLSYNGFGWVEYPRTSSQQSQLVAVDLSNNELRGFLPGFMGLMPRLAALSLENNRFSGMIPTQYALKLLAQGQQVSQFQRLLLAGNYLYGPIPGPILELKSGSVMVRLGGNCLYRCPLRFFFCEGGVQKSSMECKAF